MTLSYVKAETTRLRELGFDEKWLQDRLNEDPSILGLGDLIVITREHTQPSGGRIDFLMYDPEDGIRYEIEVMLGRVDESHIIRTLEYWDIERKRFPSLQHRAVIVAEEITNRFFNIISLLNQAIPILAIQLNAFKIEEKVVLHFTTVLDLPEPETEEEGTGEKVDRGYWEKRANPASMRIVDMMIGLVPTPDGPVRTTYNKYHIAVGTTGQNFLWFHPRKSASHCHMHVRLLEGQERTDTLQKLEDAGIYSGPRGREIKLRLSEKELNDNDRLIRDMLAACERQSRE